MLTQDSMRPPGRVQALQQVDAIYYTDNNVVRCLVGCDAATVPEHFLRTVRPEA